MTAFISTLKRRTPIWWYPAILVVQTFGNLAGCLVRRGLARSVD